MAIAYYSNWRPIGGRTELLIEITSPPQQHINKPNFFTAFTFFALQKQFPFML